MAQCHSYWIISPTGSGLDDIVYLEVVANYGFSNDVVKWSLLFDKGRLMKEKKAPGVGHLASGRL
jgi:hypothetical protein